jgi:hypothetical protein
MAVQVKSFCWDKAGGESEMNAWIAGHKHFDYSGEPVFEVIDIKFSVVLEEPGSTVTYAYVLYK